MALVTRQEELRAKGANSGNFRGQGFVFLFLMMIREVAFHET